MELEIKSENENKEESYTRIKKRILGIRIILWFSIVIIVFVVGKLIHFSK